VQTIQIVAKAQAANGREEILQSPQKMNPEELEIPAKRPSILAPPKEVDIKQIDLGSPTFSGITKISSLGSRPTCQASRESWLSTELISMKAPSL
jgi:hypothetical protein